MWHWRHLKVARKRLLHNYQFFHNLEMTNEGSVTHIETDDEDHFKMVFIAFGVAVSTFILINIYIYYLSIIII